MKIIVSFFLLLMLFINGFGQQLESGKTTELKGLTKIFVDAGSDAKTRNTIISEIEIAQLGVEFMDTIEESSVLLKFNGEIEDIAAGAMVSDNSLTVDLNPERLSVGQGIVAVAGQNNLRVLMSYGKARQSSLNSWSAVKFARKFITGYKKANSLR